MRIAIFADAYYPTIDGTVTFIDGLARALGERGHRAVAIVPGERATPSRSLEHDVLRLGSLPAVFTPPGYRLTWEPAMRVGSRLRGIDFDLVHIHSPFTAAHHGFAFARQRRLPVVLTYHTLFPAYAGLYGPRWGRRLWERAVTRRSRSVGNRCDLVVANSKPMVPVLRSYGITAPIDMIPVGINHDVFSRAERTGAVRQRFGIGTEEKVVLYAGRIGAEKSVHLLVPMLREIRQHHEAHLVLCGQGAKVDELKRLAAFNDLSSHVHFAGVVRDPVELATYYGDADVFVFPSATDTFGAVVPEAQAAGLPVVAVGVLGSTATVEDGVSGLLARHDAGDLSAKVCRILADPVLAGHLRAGGRRSAREFSAGAIATRYINAYGSVLRDRVAEVPSEALAPLAGS